MIKIENTEVVGWESAIRGMRNPMNSHSKSDSKTCYNADRCSWDYCSEFDKCQGTKTNHYIVGENDLALMKKLVKAGTVHSKFMRMIVVYCDITAPQFWWSEFDTYKVGTVRNSCSKMHKIHVKEFTKDDFSHEGVDECELQELFGKWIDLLEDLRIKFNETQEKKYWRALIELLPSGYNIKATVMLNYEVLRNIYKPDCRQHHKLDEWNVDFEGSFCNWIKTLPYSELITMQPNSFEKAINEIKNDSDMYDGLVASICSAMTENNIGLPFEPMEDKARLIADRIVGIR